VIDDDFYVEHGHRYDKFTMVLDGPTLSDNPCQINIPFGSFFNRYLINRIELFYPFLDNVRPSGNVLPILIKENFPLAIKVLFQHLPFLLRMLSTKRRYMWYMIHSVLWFSLALIAPVVLLLIFSPAVFVSFFSIFSSLTSESKIFSLVLNQSKGLGLLIASYLLSRFAGWFQLEEPSSLDNDAEQRSEGTPYKIMTMGHTHNPGEYLFNNGCRFYNTGTWIPVIENSTADIREDKTFTFLHLVRNQKNELELGNGRFLERWNDDAGRADCQIVIERK
jgi:UDP-2,3-diacylglucosamine pyrophosphatase LpxH